MNQGISNKSKSDLGIVVLIGLGAATMAVAGGCTQILGLGGDVTLTGSGGAGGMTSTGQTGTQSTTQTGTTTSTQSGMTTNTTGSMTTGTTTASTTSGSSTSTGMPTCTATDLSMCPTPSDACTAASCDATGHCSTVAITPHKPCNTGVGVCDASGKCVGCIDQTDCTAPQVCLPTTQQCAAASCMDNMQDGGETDIDCGGPCPNGCKNGKSCGTGKDCASGFCQGGLCEPCTAQTQCAPNYCDVNTGGCMVPKINGTTCGAGVECAAGNCVEGVCCNMTCTGGCVSCLGVNTGSADGTCRPILAGKDPKNQCAAGTCATGACDGNGNCGLNQPGTACGPGPSCLNPTTEQSQGTCDATGACSGAGAITCQPHFSCTNGLCNTACQNDSQCAPGFHCNTTAVLCVTCNTNADCGTAFGGGFCLNPGSTTSQCGCLSGTDCQTPFAFGRKCGVVQPQVCGCTANADCQGNFHGQTCVSTGTQRCGCLTASECGGSQLGKNCINQTCGCTVANQANDCAGIGTNTCNPMTNTCM